MAWASLRYAVSWRLNITIKGETCPETSSETPRLFNIGTSEQKIELQAMMKQHAEQVNRLRTQNREVGERVEEQSQLLDSSLEVIVGRIF